MYNRTLRAQLLRPFGLAHLAQGLWPTLGMVREMVRFLGVLTRHGYTWRVEMSGRSEAAYIITGGVKIRFAQHPPVYPCTRAAVHIPCGDWAGRQPDPAEWCGGEVPWLRSCRDCRRAAVCDRAVSI